MIRSVLLRFRSLHSSSRRRKKIIDIASLVYCIIILFLRLQHVPWRDELQNWLLLKHEGGIDFFNEFESKGSLWFFLLYETITNVFSNYVEFRYASSICLVLVLFLFLREEKITFMTKFWLAINPFFVYEFLIIDRVYTWILFTLWIIYILVSRNRQNYKVIYCFLLVLLTGLAIPGLFTTLMVLVSIGRNWFNWNRDKSYLFVIFLSFALNLFPFVIHYGRTSWTEYDYIDTSNTWSKISGFNTRLSQILYGQYGSNSDPQYYQTLPEGLNGRVAIAFTILSIVCISVYLYEKMRFKNFVLMCFITSCYAFINTFIYPGGKRHLLFLPLFLIMAATQNGFHDRFLRKDFQK